MFEVEPTGQPKIPENFLKTKQKDDFDTINLFGKNIDESLKELKPNSTSIFMD